MTETKPKSTPSFYQKILSVQMEVGKVKKSKDNPFFKSKYADINVYLNEVKPILNKNGLILLQPTVIIEGKNALETSIIDSQTGESIKSTLFIPDGVDIQKFGGGLTYLRRYELQTILALEAEDDDGNKASGKVPTKAQYDKKGVLIPGSISDNDDPFLD